MSAGATTLERQDELERIVAVLDAAATGEGQFVVIEGPAGIGKSKLVQEAHDVAKERRFGRLHATGDELESSIITTASPEAAAAKPVLVLSPNSMYGGPSPVEPAPAFERLPTPGAR